jgi:hypothetical protein
MSDKLSDAEMLKHLILSKAARGKYISVRRTISDLEACDELDGREDGRDSDMKLLKDWAKTKRAKVQQESNDTLTNISNTLAKLNDRMDKAGI